MSSGFDILEAFGCTQAMGSNVTWHEGGFTRDQHEALDFYKEVPRDTSPPSAIHGPNQWPTHVPGLKDTLQEYVSHMLLIGRGVMSGNTFCLSTIHNIALACLPIISMCVDV